jgi:hypothetical protein
MYNRILNRPMFKRGGDVIDSQGTGITSGLDTPRNNYAGGGTIGGGNIHGNPIGNRTGFADPFEEKIKEYSETIEVPQSTRDRAFWSGIGAGFGDPSSKTLGEMLWKSRAGQDQIVGPAEARVSEQKFELSKLPFERTMAMDVAKAGIAETATQTRARILDDAIALKSEWEKANPGKDFRSSPIYQNYENMIIQATQGKITTLSEARQTAFDIMMTNEDFAGTYQLWALTPAGPEKDKLKKEIDQILNQTVDYLMGVSIRKAQATGGRVGYNLGVGPNVMEGMASETIKMPGETIQATEVDAEVLPKSGSMNQIPMNKEDPYLMLRARLPQEITDDVVRLIAYNAEAFADFSAIESQEDVMLFNQKYGVELVLPTDQA